MSGSQGYSPGNVGIKGTIFGLPFSEAEASVVILPVPWDVTVSYAAGTADGPQAILDASVQLDLEVAHGEAPWKKGIWMVPIEEKIRTQSHELRNRVGPYLAQLEKGENPNDRQITDHVNAETTNLKSTIKAQTKSFLNQGKIIGLLGGDHSCPLGYLEALADHHDDFGILQVDAHMDLRKAYEGFTHSHASIMYNALSLGAVSKLVQVGIRDFCEEEVAYAKSDRRIEVFYDQELKAELFAGKPWRSLCDQIISGLPQKVYVSFDIDGLSPHLCTGTGTPVPGGLEYAEALFLINLVKSSGREIIGFDLCEVAPKSDDGEWNANVGARVLYALCGVINS